MSSSRSEPLTLFLVVLGQLSRSWYPLGMGSSAGM